MTAKLSKFTLAAGVVSALLIMGCSSTLLFNPSFVNQRTGEVYPLVPRVDSAFVLVRGNNTTSSNIEFVITAERTIPDPENPDTVITELQTYRVFTTPQQSANDIGVLFDCPVNRIGLGEVLDQPTTEPGLFVNAEAVGVGGFGIPPNINPLDVSAGNFACGDTIVFLAAQSASVPGGVAVGSFVLDADTQPAEVSGLETFINARTLIEEQRLAEEN